jgi:hypothetical protein
MPDVSRPKDSTAIIEKGVERREESIPLAGRSEETRKRGPS